MRILRSFVARETNTSLCWRTFSHFFSFRALNISSPSSFPPPALSSFPLCALFSLYPHFHPAFPFGIMSSGCSGCKVDQDRGSHWTKTRGQGQKRASRTKGSCAEHREKEGMDRHCMPCERKCCTAYHFLLQPEIESSKRSGSFSPSD